MSKPAAKKKQSSRKAPHRGSGKKKATPAKAAKAPKSKPATVKADEVKKPPEKKVNKKAIQELLVKGKKQGYLTYDGINELLPEVMLSPEQIDETLMLFDDNGIEVVDFPPADGS